MKKTCRIIDSFSNRDESVDLIKSSCGEFYWGEADAFNYCPICGGKLIEEEMAE